MSSTPRGRRPRDAAPPSDEQLIAWFEAGELLDRITRYFDLANPDHFRAAARQAGALAAAGEMDLLSFIESGAVAAVERHDFFVVMQFYIQAIPNMVEPVPRMLAAVDALVTIGGSDGPRPGRTTRLSNGSGPIPHGRSRSSRARARALAMRLRTQISRSVCKLSQTRRAPERSSPHPIQS
jgi:hypothetical protein